MSEKLTPEEIKKALECCIKPTSDCENCPYYKKEECFDMAKRDALNLINRQQAEIENADFTIEQLTKGNLQLQAEIERLKENNKAIMQTIADVHTEAIKEFAERLKEKFAIFQYVSVVFYSKVISIIDNLVKEMVGEQK